MKTKFFMLLFFMLSFACTLKAQNEEDKVYVVAEQIPYFSDSKDAFGKFLIKNLKYPEEAKKKKITGKTYLQFIVEKDGSITNVQVLKSSGDSGLDKEAVRVIKTSPKWIPAKQANKVVRFKIVQPIAFRL